ncbi:hypothetical protein HOY82DRAFT_538244 [Tuber indicum]|nr:hypothetical protein HOY82DRAFT_538244 [Tuber indicum]
MDSRLAESGSMSSSAVVIATRGQIEIDPKVTRRQENPRYISHHALEQVRTLSSPNHDGARAPHYYLAKRRVQSAVDKASRIRKCSIDSLRRPGKARPTDITTIIVPLEIEKEEFKSQLFKPCTIGD